MYSLLMGQRSTIVGLFLRSNKQTRRSDNMIYKTIISYYQIICAIKSNNIKGACQVEEQKVGFSFEFTLIIIIETNCSNLRVCNMFQCLTNLTIFGAVMIAPEFTILMARSVCVHNLRLQS